MHKKKKKLRRCLTAFKDFITRLPVRSHFERPHSPDGFKVAEFGNHVDVDRPEIASLRVVTENVLKHRPSTFRFAELELHLSELGDHVYVCSGTSAIHFKVIETWFEHMSNYKM